MRRIFIMIMTFSLAKSVQAQNRGPTYNFYFNSQQQKLVGKQEPSSLIQSTQSMKPSEPPSLVNTKSVEALPSVPQEERSLNKSMLFIGKLEHIGPLSGERFEFKSPTYGVGLFLKNNWLFESRFGANNLETLADTRESEAQNVDNYFHMSGRNSYVYSGVAKRAYPTKYTMWAVEGGLFTLWGKMLSDGRIDWGCQSDYRAYGGMTSLSAGLANNLLSLNVSAGLGLVYQKFSNPILWNGSSPHDDIYASDITSLTGIYSLSVGLNVFI